ncbi:MAG: hypothetical protein O3C67_11025, partial [Cyanobacteria bacterium]|nr:hypothetical protein [Cyanobacteriota bacterium]
TPGDYQVKFTAPDGFVFTTPDAGDDALDSDADPNTGLTQTVTLTSGEFNGTLDAGIVELKPGIDIEKFVNGVDVTDINNLPEIAAVSNVTFTYTVTNTGNVAFNQADVVVVDDNGTVSDSSDDFVPTLVASSDVGNDGILSAGETWLYTSTPMAAQNLATTTNDQDVRFVFNGWSHTTGSAGNVRTFSQDGVSVDVSAFSSNKNGGDWRTAYLGLYNGGLGVTNQGEGGSSHRLDNSGNQDYILFEFDQSVTVDRAFLDFVDCDSDISIWIGDRNGDINSANSFANFLSGITQENNFVGHSSSRWADFNNGETSGNTLVISGFTGHSNDAFKLKMLDIITQGETLIGNYQNTVTVTAGGVASATDTANYTNPDTPIFTPNHVVMEAEDMHLCDYTTEHVGDVASGGEVIRLTGHDGYAYSAFTGPSGYYQVEVTYFDENDGCATGQIKIGGKTVDTWSFNQNLPSNWVSDSNKVTRTVSEAIYIEQGEQIKLSGWFNGGEYARFDAIKFTEVEAPQHYLYEAEEMDLYNYGTEHASFASGGELIKLSGHWGYAATEFTGTDGKYDIIIGYYDENDGSARAQLKVGDDLLTAWTFSDNHLGSNVASSGNLVEKTYAGVDLLNGDELKLFGQMDAGEFARIDYIKVVAVNNSLGSGGGQTNGPDLQSTDLFAYVNDHAPGLVPVLSDALI